MAFKLVWSRSALEDLHEIVSFIARDNLSAAESFGYLLISKVDLLPQFPEMGRVVPELANPDVREIIFRSYRIIYHLNRAGSRIAISRVWHAARGQPKIPPAEFE